MVTNTCFYTLVLCVLSFSLPISSPLGLDFHLVYVLVYIQTPEKCWCLNIHWAKSWMKSKLQAGKSWPKMGQLISRKRGSTVLCLFGFVHQLVFTCLSLVEEGQSLWKWFECNWLSAFLEQHRLGFNCLWDWRQQEGFPTLWCWLLRQVRKYAS